jgi:hypothetical protein
MNTISFQIDEVSGLREPVAIVEPDFSGFDSAQDILRDASRWGLVDDLRRLLREEPVDSEAASTPKIVRDIGYELAGAKNRDFAVDLFIHVTGIAQFGPESLRDYARKHGCSHEWFRKEAEDMRRRLCLSKMASPID